MRIHASGGLSISAQASQVSSTATGIVYTISRLLGSTSVLSLAAGTNANLTLSGANILAASAIGDGVSQTAVVRETNGSLAMEYPVVLTGAAASSAAPPTNTVAPVVTGTAQEGQTMSVSNNGTWTGSPSFTYQWQRGGVDIAGSINSTRVLTSADVGFTISCRVIGTNTYGSLSATSNVSAAAIAATLPVPVNSVAPIVTGSTAIGSTLVSSTGTWSGSPTFTYQWRRDGINIPGATSGVYVTVSADGGTTITCRVLATNAGGATPAVSNGIAVAYPVWAIPLIFTSGTSLPMLVIDNGDGTFSHNYSASNFRDIGALMYVATTGSDTSGDGTSGLPFRTIQKAHDTATAGRQIMVSPGRYPPFVNTKNLSVIAVTAGTVIVCDALTNADVTSWGTPASNRQTVTLASGSVSGFVDLTLTKAGFPQVSKNQTTASAIATAQAAGDPAMFRATNSTIGASNGRDLTGKADTDLVMWRTTAAAPLTVSTSSKLYVSGIVFVGGSQSSVALGSRLVSDNCQFLGGQGQIFTSSGTTIFYRNKVRGSAVSTADVLDYQSTAFGVETECYVDQASPAGADNCSTGHGSVLLRINSTYGDAARPVHDVGDCLSGIFGCVFTGGVSATILSGTSADYSEIHVKGCTLNGSPIKDVEVQGSNSVIYAYDGSFSGKSILGPGVVIDRSTGKPTTDTTLVRFDISNLASLFQDVGGTTAVTADGQPVSCINCSVGSGAKMVLAAGVAIYHTDGTKSWVSVGTSASGASNGTRWTFTKPTALEEYTNVVFGYSSADTQWWFLSRSSTNYYGDFRNGNTMNKSPYIPIGPEVHIDSGPTNYAPTTNAAWLSSAMSGTPRVLTLKNLNLGCNMWRSSTLFNGVSGGAGFDGNWYCLEFSRPTVDANLRAREQAIAAKTGATLL